MIEQYEWITPKYTNGEIRRAGIAICNPAVGDDESDKAIKIINNWREAHAFPLYVLYMHVLSQIYPRNDIYVVTRLKRLDSIVNKLKYQGDMKLTGMQDLGGCRLIAPSIDDVYYYSGIFKQTLYDPSKIQYRDYIKSPKEKTGYRSIHLIIKFVLNNRDNNRNYTLPIELQLRTHLQHIWAAAIEVVEIFTGQELKKGDGDKYLVNLSTKSRQVKKASEALFNPVLDRAFVIQ